MDRAANLRAAGLVVGGMIAFCVNDALAKLLTSRLPTGEILALRGVFVVAILLVALPRFGMRLGRFDRYTLFRALGEAGVNAAIVLGLRLLPLGDVYTLYFTAPILLTAAAALVLHEPVTAGRWAAVLAGFLGVVIVVGPPAGWETAIMLPLLAAVLSVLRDLATRRIAGDIGSGTVALVTGTVVMLGGVATLPLGWTWPDASALLLAFGAALGASSGYLLFVMGIRAGELSFVAPFRYSAIPVAMLIGLVFWGDWPTPRTLLGAAIIVASGLAILVRRREAAPLPRAAA